jgi:hypothetical protein
VLDFVGGVDGARTRDPRRDRPVYEVSILAGWRPISYSKDRKLAVAMARVTQWQFQSFAYSCDRSTHLFAATLGLRSDRAVCAARACVLAYLSPISGLSFRYSAMKAKTHSALLAGLSWSKAFMSRRMPLTIVRRVSWCFPRRPVGAEQRTPISVWASGPGATPALPPRLQDSEPIHLIDHQRPRVCFPRRRSQVQLYCPTGSYGEPGVGLR